MSEQPPWDAFGQQDRDQYQGQPPSQGQLAYEPPDSLPPYSGPGHGNRPQPARPARFRNAAIAVVLLILVGSSVYGFVKLSSIQASLSHAQRQISATRSELSAEREQVNSDEQELSSLESTASNPPSDPLSAFSSMVCSNPDVYDSSTRQTITAYYPCSETDPG